MENLKEKENEEKMKGRNTRIGEQNRSGKTRGPRNSKLVALSETRHEEEKSGCHWTSEMGRKLPLRNTFPFLNSAFACVLNICWFSTQSLSSLP